MNLRAGPIDFEWWHRCDNDDSHEDHDSSFKDQNALFDALTDSSSYDRRSWPREQYGPVYVNTSIYVSVLGGLDTHSTVSYPFNLIS